MNAPNERVALQRIECDLLVIGSGAAGLSAAVTAAAHGLRVVVAEKEPVFGGTTAWSGGWMWTPRNPVAQRVGIVEDIELPRTYLRHVLGAHFNEARVDAFLEAAPRMVAFFEEKTALRFEGGLKIPDTYGNVPGAGTGGRSVIAAPYDARQLGDLVHRLRRPMRETTFIGMTIQAGPDLAAFLNVTRSPRAFVHAATRVTRHLVDLAVHRRGMQLRNGIALVGRLLRSATDSGVELRSSSRAVRLLQEGGAVRGAVLGTDTGEIEVRARRGVVLAAPAAYCPVSLVPYGDGTVGRFPHIIERGRPGIVGVLANGRRFCNEGNGYHDYVTALLEAVPPGEEVASWLVCTRTFQRRYGLGISRPTPMPVGPFIRSGYLKTGHTIGELARNCGINAEGLERTIAEYNAYARKGEDPAFGRGSTVYNRYHGDARVKPNPCLAPIERGPFYAVKVVPGSFGTFAGLKTDANARVLDGGGVPIPGLYAAGNDMASVMGGFYPAGGIGLGPAVTFGYIAGLHAAGARSAAESSEANRVKAHQE